MRKLDRELRQMANLGLNELLKAARRNKRLIKNALSCQFRRAYAERKTLAKLYGRVIARKLSQV